MGNFKRVELEVIWEKRAKQKKTCIFCLSKRLKQIDSAHTHTHTHGLSFVGNHIHFFLLDNYSLGVVRRSRTKGVR